MDERLRFTGTNPPPHLWERYPNWQNAYDEEDLPGQDETTLRPADNQQTIDDDVTFTAGDALFADGRSAPALLLALNGEADYIYVYPVPGRDECWGLRRDQSSRWVAMNEPWRLQGGDLFPVPVGRSGTFPLKVSSRLPLKDTGRPLDIVVELESG